ncbi:hypothetical protein SSP35_18_00800 [Streptomyces sp. NBRC 110611]|uniref:ATP-grasp domain-containing protein n=1 Tax=Streptomyces sp. NBRC 110611 TaxID=1621259 RepID=UPI0008318A06|nr:ATP-grasp domain-containing protein [Streptomyces sp. NBRC 110611]GAU70352.1 hypothetical protein SSP35_18_00800 [Streptomyces sp. NBRC 110611]
MPAPVPPAPADGGPRKTLAVVYDEGAARPGDLAVGLADWARCVFVAAPNEHTRAMQPLLARFGPVVMAEAPGRAAAELRAHRPDALVTYSEAALGLATELAAALGLPFHDRHVHGLLTDKWRQREALRVAGVDAVRCHRIESAGDWEPALAATGLPAVLKPAHGGGSRNTFPVDDAASGLELVRRTLALERPGLVAGGGLVLEEYLIGRDCGPFGDYVSVESLVRGGEVTDLAVTGKFPMVPPFRETGRFWPSPLSAAEEAGVRDLARRAVEALGVREGLTHTEVKLTPRGPRIIEVNGRLGGWINELAGRAQGCSLVEVAARVALGEAVAPPPFYRGRVYFQLIHPAPRTPCRLLAVDGIEEVNRIPGVTLYRPYARLGAPLPGGVQMRELDVVTGEADDMAGLAATAAKVDATLRYRFDFSGTECAVTGAELGTL